MHDEWSFGYLVCLSAFDVTKICVLHGFTYVGWV